VTISLYTLSFKTEKSTCVLLSHFLSEVMTNLKLEPIFTKTMISNC